MTPDQKENLIEDLIEVTLKDLDGDELYDLCCEFIKDGFEEYTEEELIKEAAAFDLKIKPEEPKEESKGFANEV